MENEFKEEIEALETLKDYNVKIVKALDELKEELKGQKKEDTDEYMQHIFKGINWEIQVLNGTMHYINREQEVIAKEDANQIILNVNAAITAKDDAKVADVIEKELLPFFGELNQKVEQVL